MFGVFTVVEVFGRAGAGGAGAGGGGGGGFLRRRLSFVGGGSKELVCDEATITTTMGEGEGVDVGEGEKRVYAG